MNLNRIRLAEGRQLLDWVRGRRFGGIEVFDGSVSVGDDHNDVPSVFLELVVSDPPPDGLSWARDDDRALRAAIREKAFEIGVEHHYVVLRSRRSVAAFRDVDAVG